MIVFTRSIVTTVLGFDGPSGASWYQPSSVRVAPDLLESALGIDGRASALGASPWFPAVVFSGMERVYARVLTPRTSNSSNKP
jgi:hypothetical protein